MKKRLSLVLVSVLGVTTLLSGCNLFPMDKRAYYEQPVATVSYTAENNSSEKIVITKEDLMQAYSRYGQTLQHNGYSGKDLVDYIVDLLIDQKIVYNEVQALIDAGQISLQNNDHNEIWETTYNNMLGLLQDYEADVIEDWKIPEPDAPEDDAEEKTEYKAYQPKAQIVKVGEDWKIQIIDNSDNSQDELIFNASQGVATSVETELEKRINSSKIAKEAQQRYIYDLKEYQKGRGFSTKNADIWTAEIERVYEEVRQNKYLSLYTEYLQKADETQYSIVDVNDVFKYLESKIKSNYIKYSVNSSAFNDDILGNRAETFYIKQDAELGEYFYVSHILVKFDEAQFTALDDALKNGYITQADYDNRRDQLVSQTLAKSYGEPVEGYTVEDLYADFRSAINSAGTTQAKLDVFNEYMYKYNEDTGNKGQDFDYVIGTLSSKMVDEFNEAARALYNNGNGQIGDISGMVESTYGVHILIYLGPVENLFNVTDIDTFSLTDATGDELAANIKKITSTPLSVLNTKTVFDLVYEKLMKDNVSMLEMLNLNTLKADTKITKYPSHYSDLY
ncbi:MAG: hypothetical protein IJ975_02300 [Clostridia bacterium]|nr:hypothetical protein [Clostridia bacterium]